MLYLPIEIVSRELDSRILLANSWVNKFRSAVIGPKWIVEKLAIGNRYGLFLYKDHSSQSFKKLKRIQEAGVGIVALDEEGLVWHSEQDYQKRIDPRILEISLAIFAWGDRQSSVIVNKSPDNACKVHVTGNPRFDVLHPRFRHFLSSLSEHTNRPNTPYVLINTRFAPGNWNTFMYGTSNYVEHMRSRGKIVTDQDAHFYKKKVEHSKALFDAYVSLIKVLSKKFPEVTFVLRPHPDENHDRWNEVLFGLENVIFAYEGSAVYWSEGARSVIYTGCTTGIESWALDKIGISYNPLLNNDVDPQLPGNFGYSANSEYIVVELLEKILNGKISQRANLDVNFVSSYIDNFYTGDAHLKIIDKLDSLLSSSLRNYDKLSDKFVSELANGGNTFLCENSTVSRLLHKLLNFSNFFYKKNHNVNAIARAKAQKFPGISLEDIQFRFSLLDEYRGVHSCTSRIIKKIAPSTYLIYQT